MNRICLVGRLTQDPKTANIGQNATFIAEFSIAVDRPMKKDETDFFNCKAFGKTAEFVGQYLGKGRLVSVSGRMESRKYEKDGRLVTVWDVVADQVNGLDRPKETEPGSKIRDNDPWIRAVPPPPLPGEIEDPFDDA